VFGAGSSPGGLGKIFWFSGPQYIFLPVSDPVKIGFGSLVIVDRDVLPEIFVGMDLIKRVVFAKSRLRRLSGDGFPDAVLIPDGIPGHLVNFSGYISRVGPD